MATMQMLKRYTHLRAEDLVQKLHRIPRTAPSASTNRLKATRHAENHALPNPADATASGVGAIALRHAYRKSPADKHVISTTTREVFIMKLRTISATFALAAALGLGLSAAPARAQTADPCSVFLCMASVSGSGAPGPECTAPIAVFHAIQVWSPAFNAPATAAARRTYLMTCPGVTPANQALLERIITMWGYSP